MVKTVDFPHLWKYNNINHICENGENMTIRFNYEIIIEYMNKNNLSKTQFCKQCNISIYTLNKMLNGNLNINSLLGLKVCKLLNIKFNDLIKISYLTFIN